MFIDAGAYFIQYTQQDRPSLVRVQTVESDELTGTQISLITGV